MNRQALWQILFIAIVVLLVGCGRENARRDTLAVTESKNQKSLETTAVELRRLYAEAQSQFERRAICLRAIDDGVLHRGGNISSVDAIFGTDLATNSTPLTDAMRVGVVHFVPDVPAPPGTNAKDAHGYFGWFMDVESDKNGVIQNYYLSNIHKGLSSGEPGNVASSVSKLKQFYAAAKTEYERREVCLQAIDAGVIQSSEHGDISAIDEIFGADLASNLTKKRDVKKTATVDFVSRPASPPDKQESKGWCMAVEYYSDGSIDNYYLTNVHK